MHSQHQAMSFHYVKTWKLRMMDHMCTPCGLTNNAIRFSNLATLTLVALMRSHDLGASAPLLQAKYSYKAKQQLRKTKVFQQVCWSTLLSTIKVTMFLDIYTHTLHIGTNQRYPICD
jgi:hypothetical protein